MFINNSEIFEQLKKEQVLLSQIKEDELIFSPFWEDFKVRFCWSSNAIEGNTLNLDETIDVVLYDEVKSGHTFKEYTEAKNQYKAINQQISDEKIEISEEWIKTCNALIMESDGEYRTQNVYIGTLVEVTYYPPHYDEISKKMEELMEKAEIKSDNIEEIICKIAEFHMLFERIHPFSDGNGRTGRMILNQQLINNGLLPIAIDKTSKYRQSFRRYDKNKDLSMLVHQICVHELEAIKRIHQLKIRIKSGK